VNEIFDFFEADNRLSGIRQEFLPTPIEYYGKGRTEVLFI